MEWDDIRPKDGEIPVRPEFLSRPSNNELSPEALIADCLVAGKGIVVGGTSFVGASMQIVPTVSVIRIAEGALRGNTLSVGHPKHDFGFRYFDVHDGMYATSDIMPDWITYFVGITDSRLAEQDAPPADLVRIARFVIPFISDEGPPKGIDW